LGAFFKIRNVNKKTKNKTLTENSTLLSYFKLKRTKKAGGK